MDKTTLEALEAALQSSPDNTALRTQIAKGWYGIGNYEKAKEHFTALIQTTNDFEAKKDLAKCYFQLKNYSPGIIICEEILEQEKDVSVMSLYVQSLINSGQTAQAIEQYQEYHEDYGWFDQEIEKQLKITTDFNEFMSGDEEDDDVFLEKPELDFSGVGGMENVKEEIRMKIIQPLENPELFKAFGKSAGGGILLYGPPGCGKTFISKATAGEISSRFLSVGLEEVLDMWIGNSEKNLHEKFEIARRNNPCVLFFDEIDAVGSKRSDLRQSGGRNLINQFLKELDGVDSQNDGVLILGATNSPWHMDSAFLRPGRFDRIIFVPPPDEKSREAIIGLQIKEKPTVDIDCAKIAAKTKGFSGADIKLLVDLAAEDSLRASMKSGNIVPITTKDLLKQIKNVRPSTKDWFNTARNYALYSNSSGLYDDILQYLDL